MKENNILQRTDKFPSVPISNKYSRAQAIQDGVLVDVSKYAKEVGFESPVALTNTVWYEIVVPDDKSHFHGQSETTRLYDLLWMLWVASQRTTGNVIPFDVLMISKRKIERVNLKAVNGRGDHFEPVTTIMFPEEG